MPTSPARSSGNRGRANAASPAGSVTKRYLSKTTLLVCLVLFVVGAVFGTITYMQRSPLVEKQVAGTNAVPTHAVLALVALGLIAGLPRHRLAQKAPTRCGWHPCRNRVWTVSNIRCCSVRVSRRQTFQEPSSPACYRSSCYTTSLGRECRSSEALIRISPSTLGVGRAILARSWHTIWTRHICSTLRPSC